MSGGGSAEAINKTARDDSGDEGGTDVPRSGSGKTRIYCYYLLLFIYYCINFLRKETAFESQLRFQTILCEM
jgi:hypothetical protein